MANPVKIVFIHGAGATKDSFNYIEPNIDQRFERTYLEYNSDDGFKNNVIKFNKQLGSVDTVFFIGHSLGGLYGIHLTHHLKERVVGSISIASPFNGAESASMLNMIKPCQLYRDISPYSEPIVSSHKIKIKCPWTQIVTIGGGSHWMSTKNDGVVTKKSMTHRSDMNFIEVESGHYEIMLRSETVDIINNEIGMIS